jgi:hypothetical protein
MVMSRQETEFTREMVHGVEALKVEIGYNPTRFSQMVTDYGGPEAARRLLSGPNASDGFTTLWMNSRLDMSVEFFALLPWYADLFTETQRATARFRLSEHKFDVDAALAERLKAPPAWWQTAD